MPSQRLVQAGHLLATFFVALLLVGARAFLVADPLLAALLLAAFVPAYYAAARITQHRQFLYPAALLLVLAHQLLLHGAGLPVVLQPLDSLVPAFILYLAARAGVPRGVPAAARSLDGVNSLLVAAFSVWILLRLSWFYQQAPVATAAALIGYAGIFWLRFLRSEHPLHASATVVLGSGGFLFLLYSHSQATLLAGAIAGVLVVAGLYRRRTLPAVIAIAFALVGIYLVYIGITAPRATLLPLGYLVLAALWLHLGMVLYRPEEVPLLGPHPAPLPRLLPLFAGGIVLGVLPIALFYPWKPLAVALAYLTIFFVVFLATGRELGRHAFTLLGVALARLLCALARLATLAALLYLALEKFPPSYGLALGAASIGVLALLAAWRQAPRVFTRRNAYVYEAGVFLSVAYVLAERRLAPAGSWGVVLDSGVLLLLAIVAAGELLRRSVLPNYLRSLWDISHLPVTAACMVYVLAGTLPLPLPRALLLGALMVAAAGVAFARVRLPAILFTLPVVLGFWTYVVESGLGVRGEALGLPYLVYGVISAAAGYVLLRRDNRWFELFYFMWFLCAGVALVLFYPYRAAGAYAAPLWPLTFLLVARARASRRDFPFALALEITSGVLAAASVATLLWQGLYLPAAVALLLYALLYAGMGGVARVRFYLYPAAACAVAACFLGILQGPGARLFLPYFFPLALVLYLLAALLRKRGLADDAFPVELSVHAGALLGAALFLALPFAIHLATGTITGLAYLALFLLLTRYRREPGLLAGAGLAGAFAVYQFLPALPGVTSASRLGWFIPVGVALVLLGRRRQGSRDANGMWGLFGAAIVVALAASVFALWPAPQSLGFSRVVLVGALVVWFLLLLWTRGEVFIYCATLGLAMLAYNFVQSSADLFGQHLVAFFLYGIILLGLVFVAAATRHWLRFRGPLLFVPPERWYQRFVYLLPVAVLGVATLGSWGVSTSSNPVFCGTCHTMGTYYANWKDSAHARAHIDCARCHYEPGLRGYVRAKIKGTSELVTTLTGTEGYKPVARVANSTCLSGGCHSAAALGGLKRVRGTYLFSHARHLAPLGRGPELRCTSCHTQVSAESHFAVDTNACFTCHFQAASAPRPATAVGCVGCHGLPEGARGTAGFDHVAAGVTAGDATCVSCHPANASGSPHVEERACRHCHVQSTGRLLAAGSTAIHRAHVSERGIGCDWCHGVVRHGNLDIAQAAER